MSGPEDHPELQAVVDVMPHQQLAPAHGIATIALSMALRWHDIATVQDGALYQQYKLEGRNMETLHLDMVFETAIRMEKHLLASSDRIAAMLMEAIIEPEDGEKMPDEGAGEQSDG